MPKILIIEDEPQMVLGLRDNFEYEGYEVAVARDGQEGLAQALMGQADLIVLDLMLPKLGGLDVCRELRRQGIAAPIIMLTARGQEIDKIIGLEVGADDYVTKPFSLKELLARVRALLRRASRQVIEIKTYRLGELVLDFKNYHATKAGQPLALSPLEFELLQYFIQHRGEAITRDQLLDAVWGYDNFPLTRTVDNHIAKLRQKIEANPTAPQYIITLHRIGYKFLG